MTSNAKAHKVAILTTILPLPPHRPSRTHITPYSRGDLHNNPHPLSQHDEIHSQPLPLRPRFPLQVIQFFLDERHDPHSGRTRFERLFDVDDVDFQTFQGEREDGGGFLRCGMGRGGRGGLDAIGESFEFGVEGLRPEVAEHEVIRSVGRVRAFDLSRVWRRVVSDKGRREGLMTRPRDLGTHKHRAQPPFIPSRRCFPPHPDVHIINRFQPCPLVIQMRFHVPPEQDLGPLHPHFQLVHSSSRGGSFVHVDKERGGFVIPSTRFAVEYRHMEA